MLYDLTGFQRDLLFVLSGMGAPSGNEIMRELERSQDRNILHGRLYSNLDTLVEQGLVEKGKMDGRTNTYTITSRGLNVVEARYEWQRGYLHSTGQSVGD